MFIDLNDALNLTIENHPLIKMRKQDILASQNSLASSKWLAFPSVSSQTLPDRQGSGTTTMVRIDQPIWAGGRISASIDQSTAKLHAAEASLNDSEHNLLI